MTGDSEELFRQRSYAKTDEALRQLLADGSIVIDDQGRITRGPWRWLRTGLDDDGAAE